MLDIVDLIEENIAAQRKQNQRGESNSCVPTKGPAHQASESVQRRGISVRVAVGVVTEMSEFMTDELLECEAESELQENDQLRHGSEGVVQPLGGGAQEESDEQCIERSSEDRPDAVPGG